MYSLFCCRLIMDGEDDCYSSGYSTKSPEKSPISNPTECGDMNFMMVDYLKDAMKVIHYAIR